MATDKVDDFTARILGATNQMLLNSWLQPAKTTKIAVAGSSRIRSARRLPREQEAQVEDRHHVGGWRSV
jgi:hypothetical protein